MHIHLKSDSIHLVVSHFQKLRIRVTQSKMKNHDKIDGNQCKSPTQEVESDSESVSPSLKNSLSMSSRDQYLRDESIGNPLIYL